LEHLEKISEMSMNVANNSDRCREFKKARISADEGFGAFGHESEVFALEREVRGRWGGRPCEERGMESGNLLALGGGES
jgi:hypothetical protein